MANGQRNPHDAIMDDLRTPGREPPRLQQSPRTAAERAIAGFPGVGEGLLDTLRTLFGKELSFDVGGSKAGAFGEFQRRGTTEPDRVVVNLTKLLGTRDPEFQAPVTLVHEALGHGLFEIKDEGLAETVGRNFMRLSGRTPDLPFTGTKDFFSYARLKELLERMNSP